MSAHRKSITDINNDPIMNMRPPKLGCWEQFSLFLYNKEEGTYLNRTCLSWAQIIGFYTVFYAALVGFFAICMYFMIKTIDPLEPKYYGDSSILQSPGMTVRPHPPLEGHRVMIWDLKRSMWINAAPDIDTHSFFKEYMAPHNNTVKCDFGANCTQKWAQGSEYHDLDSCTEELSEEQACEVNYLDWDVCAPKNDGNLTNMPCMYFRLNKVYKWRPHYYDDSQELPDVPAILRNKIDNTPARMRDRIWLTCEVKEVELRIPTGKVSYYPKLWEGSFPGYYFPWHRQKNYISPVVAVHFEDIRKNTLVDVDCKLWAKKVPQEKKHQVAWLSFRMKFTS